MLPKNDFCEEDTFSLIQFKYYNHEILVLFTGSSDRAKHLTRWIRMATSWFGLGIGKIETKIKPVT